MMWCGEPRARFAPDLRRRRLVQGAAAAWGLGHLGRARAKQPVLIGFDGEIGVTGSTSAQAILAGIEVAIDEVNAAGGVLGGRPLVVQPRDNRAMPARATRNLRAFAALPDLVAVFGGRYSPAVLEVVPLVHELGLPLLNPWASADGIIAHGLAPSYTFRLAMADSWALPVMAEHAARRGLQRLGMVAVNTSWGRSSERALRAHLLERGKGQRLLQPQWFNYTDGPEVFSARYAELLRAGVDAVLFIGNFREGSELVRGVAQLPAADRRPLLAHGGVTGGDFFAACGEAIQRVDVAVIQSFGFTGNQRPRAAPVRAAALQRLAVTDDRVPSPAGLAHAYDLTHILARAIADAGSTTRSQVRDALERSRPHAGLIRDYPAPFTATRHEALAPGDLYMARFDAAGALVRIR